MNDESSFIASLQIIWLLHLRQTKIWFDVHSVKQIWFTSESTFFLSLILYIHIHSIPEIGYDLGVRGGWQPQAQALFDVRVIDTNAPSGVQRSVAAVLSSAKGENATMQLICQTSLIYTMCGVS